MTLLHPRSLRALPAGGVGTSVGARIRHMDRTLVASWTPYDWRRAHERGSGSEDTTVGDWREAIRTKVKGP